MYKKVTVNINGVDTEIVLTEEQVASIEAQSKPKKFEFNYEKDKAIFLSISEICTHYNGTVNDYLFHGRYRKTKEGAEISFKRNKLANRLEALAEYLGGLKEFEFGESNFIVCQDIKGVWYLLNMIMSYNPCHVYMVEECADKICELLNSGQYSL